MNCAVHTDVAATGFCRQCGKALCPECTRDVGGALYCASCLTGAVPAAQRLPGGSHTHPVAALLLGFIPGLGAVYNGEYMKALIHVVVFGGIIAALNAGNMSDGYYWFLGIALGCFYFYMPIEAFRVAKARQMGEPEPTDLLYGGGTNRPIGAIVLIVVGLLFLLSNFGLLRAEWIIKDWPIGLIAIGAWILIDRVKSKF